MEIAVVVMVIVVIVLIMVLEVSVVIVEIVILVETVVIVVSILSCRSPGAKLHGRFLPSLRCPATVLSLSPAKLSLSLTLSVSLSLSLSRTQRSVSPGSITQRTPKKELRATAADHFYS